MDQKTAIEKLKECRTKYGLAQLTDEMLDGLTREQAVLLLGNIQMQIDAQMSALENPKTAPNPMLETVKGILVEAMKSPEIVIIIERIEATENRIKNIEDMLIKMQKK